MEPFIDIKHGLFDPYVGQFVDFVFGFLSPRAQVVVLGCVFLPAGLWCLYAAVRALRSGVFESVNVVTMEFDRDESPAWYWFHVCLFLSSGTALTLWGAAALLGLWAPLR